MFCLLCDVDNRLNSLSIFAFRPSGCVKTQCVNIQTTLVIYYPRGWTWRITSRPTTQRFCELQNDAAKAATNDSFSAAGAATPSRAKNNGATTTCFCIVSTEPINKGSVGVLLVMRRQSPISIAFCSTKTNKLVHMSRLSLGLVPCLRKRLVPDRSLMEQGQLERELRPPPESLPDPSPT